MRKLYFILMIVLSLLQVSVSAQDDGGVSIGKGNQDADGSAILELVSGSKGLLIPRMSSSQRSGISSPANGLLVYDTGESSFYYYSNTGWQPVGGGVSSDTGTSAPVSGVKEGDLFYNSAEEILYVYVSGSWEMAGSKSQVLELDGTTLKLLKEGESTGSQVDLSTLQQSLSLSGTSIRISGGNSVELGSLFHASFISVSPAGGISSTNVQSALEELQAEVAAFGSDLGDMKSNTYDTNKDGIVDNARTVNGLTVDTAVPSGALFSDDQRLYYDSSTRQISISNGNTIQLPASATGGDMAMSIYDTNTDNIVDQAATVVAGGVTSSSIAAGAVSPASLSGAPGNGTSGQVLTSNGTGGFTWGSGGGSSSDATGVLLSSGYTKPTSGGALVAGESVQSALGKLEKGLESATAGGGEANVQADWNISDTGSDAYIKNKPAIGIAANNLVQLDATGKLPAVDGSQLTNLPGGVIADGSITTVKIANATIKPEDLALATGNTATNDYVLSYTGGEFKWIAAPTGGASLPLSAKGDIIYSSDASGTAARLEAGTDGQVLTLASGVPTWADAAGGGALNVTAELTASYTATATDDIILFNVNTSGNTLTLPSSGVPIGKVYYVSLIGGKSINLSPAPRDTGFAVLYSGYTYTIVCYGDGKYVVASTGA